MTHDETAGVPRLRAATEELAATTVVPTLEAPLRGGQNTLYAGTFGLVWAALEADAGGPVEVEGMADLGSSLRAYACRPGDVDEAAYLARAARGPEGLAAL